VQALSWGAPTPSKVTASSSKAGPSKKKSVLKLVHPRAKTGAQGTSKIELALAKSVGISKKIAYYMLRLRSIDSVVQASPQFMLVSALIEWHPLTILVTIHRLTLTGPLTEKAVEKSAPSLPSMPN
jgi:hypothetical protein